jgi:Ca2+-binding RTX toxin-like protein
MKAALGLRSDAPHRRAMRADASLVALAALALTGVSTAQAAGTAQISDGVLVVTGGPDVEFGKIMINPSGSGAEWIVQDEHDSMLAGPGCSQVAQEVSCPRAGTTSVEVDAGDFKDHVRATVDIPATILLGPGPDQARGGSASDYIDGGPGEDNLEGRDGADVLDGGDDRDTALYVLRAAAQPVTVTLDGLANDGGAEDGFSDHILANVENVNATPGDDVIVGNDGPNNRSGGPGDDQITAGGADDTLSGQEGNDGLSGEAGADALDGGDGGDVVDGGSEWDNGLYKTRTASQPVKVTLDGNANDGGAVDGNADNVLANVETVTAGSGADTLVGSAGDNTLTGNGGRDVLDGGAGADILDGGTERDVVLYEGRGASEPVNVSIDGVANDGGAPDGGANDNVRTSVENVRGGAGDDTITGSAGANALTGNAGVDQLIGLAGNDELYASGDGFDDTASCGAGPKDRVFADPTDSFPIGGPDACEIIH